MSLGPDAHQEFDIVQRPGAALKVPVCPVELFGIGAVHAYVPLVVLVKVSSDPDDIFGTARMESKAQADFSDEVVEALLTVERSASKWKGEGPSVFNAEGKGSADITDGCFGDRTKTGRVRPSLSPGRKAPVSWGFPGVHPDRQTESNR